MSSLPRLRESGLLRWMSVWMDRGILGWRVDGGCQCGWRGGIGMDGGWWMIVGRWWVCCLKDGVD